ncbi:alpha/beta-hydrolase [Saccharata proteae CBS 121410]|uniref:Alpha/beta-hydrolase n=1 Tax=Saccharata proteae CBS 121410 TaxID=1314787 RepID=A0A9P4LSX3_9PEZI|nr:alpha/beta-hydrolase [Saccharata proteae CBS 121410]
MPYLQLSYKRIHYTDHPPTNTTTPRATLILHHGLGSSQNYYAALIPHLTSLSYRCIAFDTTGAARSPHTQIEQSIPSLAADVLALLAHFAIPRAVIVGHSMGAMVASHLCATHPEKFLAAVLIGPVHPGPEIAAAFQKRIQLVTEQGMEAMANTVPSSATAASASPLARAWIREVLLAQDKWGYVSNCNVIANAQPPRYADVRCPVLVLHGDEDKSAPMERAEIVLRELGSGEKRLEVLPETGHWHCVERPGECGRLMGEFLEGLSV